MAGTGEGKKEEADYKRLHSFPLIRVGEEWGKYHRVQDKNPLTAAESSPVCSDNFNSTFSLCKCSV